MTEVISSSETSGQRSRRDGEPPPNRSVSNALSILELLAADGQPLGVTDIARTLNLSVAGAYRLLSTLQARGYVEQDGETARYSVGVGAFALAHLSGARRDLRAVALPHMAELNEVTGETVHLAVYDRGDVICIEKVDSRHPVAPTSSIGTRAPAFCVAAGRALLAFQPRHEIERVLSQPRASFTEHTVTERAEIDRQLEATRRDDYAVNVEGWRVGVGGIAAPVRDYSGHVRATVSCIAPVTRLGRDRRRTLIRETGRAAAAISRDVGFHAPASAGRGEAARRAQGSAR